MRAIAEHAPADTLLAIHRRLHSYESSAVYAAEALALPIDRLTWADLKQHFTLCIERAEKVGDTWHDALRGALADLASMDFVAEQVAKAVQSEERFDVTKLARLFGLSPKYISRRLNDAPPVLPVMDGGGRGRKSLYAPSVVGILAGRLGVPNPLPETF